MRRTRKIWLWATALPKTVGLGLSLSMFACTGQLTSGNGERPTDDGNDKGGEGGQASEGGSSGSGPIEGPIPETKDACAEQRVSSGANSWRRLTAVQYKNTIKDLLGIDVDVSLFLSDTPTGRFLTNASTATPDAQVLKYQDAAAKVSAQAVHNLDKLLACPAGTGEDACAARFFNDFGARVLRRPLSEEDKTIIDAVYKVGKATSFANGIRLSIEALLQMPSFLYLVEYGSAPKDGVAPLDAYELATRLSYLLVNTTPDAELTKAAREGSLNTTDGLRSAATRLMSHSRFQETLFAFHEQLFGIDRLGKQGGVVRDVKRYPNWTDALTSAMRSDSRQFVEAVFSKGSGTLSELLTAPYVFPTGPLVDLYGGSKPGSEDGRVTFSDGSRKGILTQAATLSSAVPLDSLYRAVMRGKLLREQIFCEELPAVPGNVVFKERPGQDKMTQQELLRVHQEDPTCKACHQLMDPLGFAFENYDGIGAHRSVAEDGRAVDTSGTIVGTDVEGSFAATAQFIDKLASSKDVRACFARQWFRFAAAREPQDADACSLAKVRDELVKGAGNLREALLLLVDSDSFRYRGGL